MDDTLTLALSFASRGWCVFPCRANKRPATPNGFKDASCEPDQVRRLWAQYPGELVGIACEMSGLFALDVDRKNGVDGDRVLHDLIALRGEGQPMRVGPVQFTPSGGYHVLFSLPAGVKVPNNANLLGPGLDLRSSGYVCSGPGYAWQPEHGPDTPLPAAPTWLVDFIQEIRKPADNRNSLPTGHNAPAQFWYDRYTPLARNGNRNDTLYHMGLQMSWSEVPESEAVDYARRFASTTGLPDSEAVATLRSAYHAPKRAPSFLLSSVPAMGTDPSPQPLEVNPFKLTSFADMSLEIGPIRWAWPGWLPEGMLVILAGESGEGKSAVLLRISESVLRSLPWPDGQPFTGATGGVLWCEAEASQALNLERVRLWGLPAEQLYAPFTNGFEDLRLDLDEHRRMLAYKAALPEVRLVIIDSLRGVLGQGDENASDTLNATKFLAELARDTGKPFLLAHHLRKRSILDGDGITLDRLRGSSAIVQTARLVWALDAPDPARKSHKRLSVIKSNLGKFPPPLGVEIDDRGVHFGDAPQIHRPESAVEKACAYLRGTLSAGPLPAAEIENACKAEGFSERTLDRAKGILHIDSKKTKTGWLWSLPPTEIEPDD